jgi:hypothetical protein
MKLFFRGREGPLPPFLIRKFLISGAPWCSGSWTCCSGNLRHLQRHSGTFAMPNGGLDGAIGICVVSRRSAFSASTFLGPSTNLPPCRCAGAVHAGTGFSTCDGGCRVPPAVAPNHAITGYCGFRTVLAKLGLSPARRMYRALAPRSHPPTQTLLAGRRSNAQH